VRKVSAAIAGVLLLWASSVFAPSAAAHDEHANWFKWREPEDNSDVSGEKVALRAKVQFEEGVSRWAVEILPPDGYATMTSWGVVCESLDKDKRSNTVEISCEWNTAAYPDGKPSRNHAYRARVMAWNEASQQQPDGSGSSAEQNSDGKGQGGSGGEGGGSGGGSGESGGGSGSGSKSDETTTSSSSTSSTSTSTTSSTTTTTTKNNAGASEKHLSPVRTLVVATPRRRLTASG
jgi:Predicted solute binding protein